MEAYGTWCAGSEGAQKVGQKHSKVPLFHLWKVMENRSSSQWLEKYKYIPTSQKGDLGNNRVSFKSVSGHIVKQALIEAVAINMKDKTIGKHNMSWSVANDWSTDCHQWWNNLLSGWGQSRGCYLTPFQQYSWHSFHNSFIKLHYGMDPSL